MGEEKFEFFDNDVGVCIICFAESFPLLCLLSSSFVTAKNVFLRMESNPRAEKKKSVPKFCRLFRAGVFMYSYRFHIINNMNVTHDSCYMN